MRRRWDSCSDTRGCFSLVFQETRMGRLARKKWPKRQKFNLVFARTSPHSPELFVYPISEQLLTGMSELSRSDDPSRSEMYTNNNQVAELLLQTFPQSPVLAAHSQDSGQVSTDSSPNNVGTFLVMMIPQKWQQQPDITTTVPVIDNSSREHQFVQYRMGTFTGEKIT